MMNDAKTVMLLGATGTIGQATKTALGAAGYDVVAPQRNDYDVDQLSKMMQDKCCRAVISCLASRSGAPDDAWAVDYGLNSLALQAAVLAGVAHFVMLSAICVQKPRLAFQKAKLAFEAELQASGLVWSIVRPTAFFKSLSGQIGRLRQGKPFLLFGDGQLTACKPISDDDLAEYLVACLTDQDLANRVLPIGGPGPAITPKQQGNMLFAALGKEPHFKHVPVALMSGIIGLLSAAGWLRMRAKAKAELAKIGRYYATESMLVWDGQRYDADATPEFGTQTLGDHYEKLVAEGTEDARGDHAIY